MATATVRQPAVAGKFYPRDPRELAAEVGSYDSASGTLKAVGCVVPHAGYMYSGHVAGAVYGALELPRRFVILCPNHTGLGSPLSIMSEGEWETPLGNVRLDAPLAASLKAKCPLLTEDAGAHRYEHAIEVQLPFLQVRLQHFSFVPIAIGTSNLEQLQMLGTAIAEAIYAEKEPVLVIASSDMNHYESDSVTRSKDSRAIERMLAMDPRGLHEVVTKEDISMCGYGAATSMLTAAKGLGAKSAELIKYATSADVSGDQRMVVGYAGIAVL